ncbi:hypothetical protein WICPIJ_005644 [Wickerhamomyces pijperi]|uniref:Protein RMD9, mitochondrial n=1 Tax=Wickerhamomyces pijperi TaxID=599730 RepID=A0A9P8TLM4_WICPI|nr:hypothetical protein WICPIJ_005644 [Wickerhamomyces pijperi]
MFRLTQTNVLKARLTNQVVRTARDSFNHSIRFNSVAIERTPSQDINNSNFSFSSTIKQVANLNNQVNNNNNNTSTNNKNNNKPQQSQQRNKNRRNNGGNSAQSRNGIYLNPSSPWYNQLVTFQECLTDASNSTESAGHLFYWESLRKAMTLYDELKSVPDFNGRFTGALVHALHIALRSNRTQLTRLAKKPDYDQNSFHNEMNQYIKDSLRTVTKDLLSETVSIDENGAMHLLTALKELKLDSETVSVWSSCIALEKLKFVFLQPKVVGVLLPIMFQLGSSYADLETLFNESNSLDNRVAHPFLLGGMIKASLAAQEYEKALKYYNDLCDYPEKGLTVGSLVDVHLAFIGESKNIDIASAFFEKAVNREMPYKLTLQVNNVKQFLCNIWSESQDFSKVLDVWVKATKFYGRNINHGVSSSLNNQFFEIFFENYQTASVESLNKLKEIISSYNDMKPIDEPFFNIIISKVGIWGDKSIIDSLSDAYGIYNLRKTQVSRRIYLKSLGSVEATAAEIITAWNDLIACSDAEGYSYIANADWAALRDATIASKFKRNELYVKVWKKYQFYCRNFDQFQRISNNGNLFADIQPLLAQINQIDASEIVVPQFQNLTYQQFN